MTLLDSRERFQERERRYASSASSADFPIPGHGREAELSAWDSSRSTSGVLASGNQSCLVIMKPPAIRFLVPDCR
jgi:hypothetical protein